MRQRTFFIVGAFLFLTPALWSDDAPARDEPKLSAKDFEAIWDDFTLSDDDGVKKAYRHICTLIGSPKQALTFLRARLKPVPAPDQKKIDQWLADLDSNDFNTRESASKELERIGALALPALRKKLDSQLPSLEVRRRMERIIEKTAGVVLSAEDLRATRAIEVLHGIGNAEAQELLTTLSRGAAGAKLTEDAKSALALLARRSAKP